MFLLSEVALRRTMQRKAVYFNVGIVLFFNPFLLPVGWGVGTMTGFFLCSLAIYAAVFARWESDPGLWMLAAFLAVAMGACLALFEFWHLRKILILLGGNAAAQPVDWARLRWSIDALAALFVLGKIVRLSATVVVFNWRITQAMQRAKATAS